VKQREHRRYEVTHVPAPVRNRDRLIGIGEPALPRYERIYAQTWTVRTLCLLDDLAKGPAIMTDAYEFHSGARAAVEERGRTLLSRIKENVPSAQPPQPFQSERPIAGTYTDTDIVGPSRMWRTDKVGRKNAALFWRDHRAYGLFDADYQELRSLVDLVSKNKSIRRQVSAESLEDIIFDWCESQFNSTDPSSLCDSIVATLRTSVRLHTVWVPIANLETEVSFAFGSVRIDRITKEMLDKQEANLAKDNPDAVVDIAVGFEKRRHELQGLAAW
jgi:hypothetical protein